MKKSLLLLLFLFSISFLLFSQNYSLSKNSTIFTTQINDCFISIETYGANCFRVTKSVEKPIVENNSFSVIKNQGGAKIKLRNTPANYTLNISRTKIEVNKQTGIIRFSDLKDKLLLTENPTENQFEPTSDVNGKGYKIRQNFRFTENEGIYGMGQDQRGIMNYRGKSLWWKQRNMFVALPFILSSKGYGILWDNASVSNFNDNKDSGASIDSEIGDFIDYYFLNGISMDGTIAVYRELTGKAPMFPKWAFGFLQSRERYTNEKEIVDIVQKYRDLKLPIDGIIQDWRYWGDKEGQWNSMEFEPSIFSNPEKMIQQIHTLNAHAMISVWPSFGNTSNIYKDLDFKNLLLNFKTFPNTGNEKVYDAYSSEARLIYWKHLNKNIFSKGMDAWWLDAVEPEQSSEMSLINSNQTALGSYMRVANAYPLFSIKGVYENQRSTTSDKRVFILTRSAYLGQQRFGAATWSGDVEAGWSVFRDQISSGVNFSMSGIPYWTTDIGAFWVRDNIFPGGNKNPLYQELYVRWFQFGAFTPLFRSHGTSTPREVFNFGEKGYWAYDVQEKYLNLRYRLLPYIYSLAWQVSSQNASILRGLMMDFPNDSEAQHLNNQYMFGLSVLVAPVTESQYLTSPDSDAPQNFKDVKKSRVYLPKAVWFDFWTGQKMNGGTYIFRETPIDIIPLYVREGSIIPIGKTMQYADEKLADTLEIRIYSGKKAEFTLYEDENDNYNYEKGQFSTIKIKWNEVKKELIFEKREGSFPRLLKNRVFNVVFVSDNHGVGDEMTSDNFIQVKYSGNKVKIEKQ